jgi:hypothetical protein
VEISCLGASIREIPVLYLVTADAVPVRCGGTHIAANIDADTAVEVEIGEDGGGNEPFDQQIRMGAVEGRHRRIGARGPG